MNTKTKEEEKEDYILGIDFGTTLSCAAIIINDKLEVVQDPYSEERIIPSVVCYKENGQILVGTDALNNKIEYVQSTIFECKRFIGHKSDDETQSARKTCGRSDMALLLRKPSGRPGHLTI